MDRPDDHPTAAATPTPDEFRDVIGRFASGVTVITASHDGTPLGATASAVSSLSLEPPMLLVCLRQGSATGAAIAATRRFAVNVLSEEQAEHAMRFARPAADRFAGVECDATRDGIPLLRGALATIECDVTEAVTGGTHTVFLARVARAHGRDGAPLAYYRGQFGRLELAQDQAAADEIRGRVLRRELEGDRPLDAGELGDELAQASTPPAEPRYAAAYVEALVTTSQAPVDRYGDLYAAAFADRLEI